MSALKTSRLEGKISWVARRSGAFLSVQIGTACWYNARRCGCKIEHALPVLSAQSGLGGKSLASFLLGTLSSYGPWCLG